MSGRLPTTAPPPLLSVRELQVRFEARAGSVVAVQGVSFDVQAGECLALVGESGSGKSVTARSLVGLAGAGAQVHAQTLQLAAPDLGEPVDLRALSEARWRGIRGRRVGFVLQDALSSLDPLRQVGQEIAEPLKLHRTVPRHAIGARVLALLREVGVPEPELRAAQYPHELSGGLRQRALIATAIAAEPELLVADEPTTALDVTVQLQILRLLAQLKAQGRSILLISHDLAVVARLADRIAVMKEGRIVEAGPAHALLAAPQHPYTQRLLAAVPSVQTRGWRLSPPSGDNHHGRARVARPTRAVSGKTLIEARDLARAFAGPGGSVRQAVQGASFTLSAGETLGIVGESGSGKTTLARLVLGLEPADRGQVLLEGEAWSGLPESHRRARRPRIQAVWQDPLGSFDPRYRVGELLDEALAIAQVPPAERLDRGVELLEQVGLDLSHRQRHPAQLSGGQRQRVAIARALAYRPAVLVCDEPVSALDVSVQAQVLDLLDDLQAQLGLGLLFISHDLGVIQHVSDRLLVMKDGQVVEADTVERIFASPSHPYTRELIASVPSGALDAASLALPHAPRIFETFEG